MHYIIDSALRNSIETLMKRASDEDYLGVTLKFDKVDTLSPVRRLADTLARFPTSYTIIAKSDDRYEVLISRPYKQSYDDMVDAIINEWGSDEDVYTARGCNIETWSRYLDVRENHNRHDRYTLVQAV